MKRAMLALAATLLLPLQAFAGWCGPFQLSAYAINVPGEGGIVTLSAAPIYMPTATSWYFGTTFPADTHAYITDVVFSSKNVSYPSRGTRSSYLVLNGLFTVAEHMSGQVHFRVPVVVPPGFTIDGGFVNNSPEAQSMIAVLTGYAWDSEECRQRFH